MTTDYQPLPRPDKFRLEIDGIQHDSWISLSGIKNKVEPKPYKEIDDKGTQGRMRPGTRDSFGTFTVTRLFDGATYFSDWWEQVMRGEVDSYMRNGSIVLLDNDGRTEIARFDFRNAWLSEYSLSDLQVSVGNTSPLTETMTIVHEGLDRV